MHAFNPEPEQMQTLLENTQKLATELLNNKNEQYQLLRKIVERVEVSHDQVIVYVKVSALTIVAGEGATYLIAIKNNMQIQRCGYAKRLIITDESKRQSFKDQNLISHISQAYQWLTLIISGKVQSIKEIAEAEQLDQSHVTRMINKAFLAPDIIRSRLNGTQPPHLTLKYIKQYRALPNDWNSQKSLLGFTQ